ncbi:MAG: divalent cation transporter [Colwellia sp.]|nr:divalent cation transporter [Colwellia sp.]
MDDVLRIITWTFAAGICIPAGGAIAHASQIRPNWLDNESRHFIIALGGGILLGAIILVFIPEGIRAMDHSLLTIVPLVLGGTTFFLIEHQLGIKRRESPQLAGMLLDYIPECIALGGLIVVDFSSALLLAVLIGLQNIPEGFNAYREIVALTKNSPKTTLSFMTLLAFLGPLAGLVGFYVFTGYRAALGATMLFSAGGILYLIFQDIAPQSRLEKHWAPPLGAVIGVGITLFGQLVIDKI